MGTVVLQYKGEYSVEIDGVLELPCGCTLTRRVTDGGASVVWDRKRCGFCLANLQAEHLFINALRGGEL